MEDMKRVLSLEDLKILIIKYYSDERVLYELVKNLKGREFCFLTPREINENGGNYRGIKAHNIGFLKSNFDRFDFFKSTYNLYNSMAYLVEMPMFSYNMAKRKEQYMWFNKNFKDYFKEYDLGFDFDNKGDFEMCYSEYIEFKNILDEYKVIYHTKCSGSGFHINIPGEYIVAKTLSEKVKQSALIANALKKDLGITTLNPEIINTRLIWKTPYSLDVKTGRIALPLDDNQAKNFDFDMVSPESVLSIKNLGFRGLLQREGNKDGFTKFVEDYVYGS